MFLKTFSLLPFHAGSPVSLFLCVLSPSSRYFLGCFSLLPKPFLSPLSIPSISHASGVDKFMNNLSKFNNLGCLGGSFRSMISKKVSKGSLRADCLVFLLLSCEAKEPKSRKEGWTCARSQKKLLAGKTKRTWKRVPSI